MSRLPTAGEYGVDNVLYLVTNVYGLQVEIKNDEGFFKCVAHSPDNHPSCSVNLKTGYYKCFSCGVGGDILSLGTRALKKTKLQVAVIISPSDPQSVITRLGRILDAKRQYETRSTEASVAFEVPEISSYDDGPMDYMYKRGFTDQTLEMFQVKYVTKARILTKNNKKMMIARTIAIPIFDEGVHLGWVYRATDKSPKWQPRYLYTPGLNVGPILFAYDKAIRHVDLTSCVTEGPIDTMWLWQCGFVSVATFGSNNVQHPRKVSQLTTFRNLIICSDNNEAGVQLVHKLYDLTGHSVSAKVFRYRKGWTGTDPNELTKNQICHGIAHAVMYHDWTIRHNFKTGVLSDSSGIDSPSRARHT